ncbi:MAG TPA: response regulator [Trichocoleus sp.]|jgi:CheY-like chemotaxis protein
MSKRILIIDDEDAIREVMQGCLEELGAWQVLTAGSGREGLQIAQAEQPDGILLDVSMPEMDGFEVLRQLRETPDIQHIPVLLLTARVQFDDQTKLAQWGVIDIILKPFSPLEVIDQIATAFGWST